MRTVTLDSVLKSWCDRKTPSAQHWYTEALAWAREWIRTWDESGGPTPSMISVPVTDRVVRIPTGFSVGNVGVDVRGSFMPLGINDQMLDLDNNCFTPTAPHTGNPDYPTWAQGSTAELTWERWMLGAWGAWGSATTYWPGQGGGQSEYGYYKLVKEKGYILLDETVAGKHEHVILDGSTKTFIPYSITRINELAIPALEAWLAWKITDGTSRAYAMHMEVLRSNMNREPLSVIVAAWQRGYGKLGSGV